MILIIVTLPFLIVFNRYYHSCIFKLFYYIGKKVNNGKYTNMTDDNNKCYKSKND